MIQIVPASSFQISSPLATALLFSLAGAFFLGFYFIHRIRRRNLILERQMKLDAILEHCIRTGVSSNQQAYEMSSSS